MNFDLEKTKFVPFSISEKEVRERFYDFIIDNDNAPVDVAYNAKIVKVNKIYYPIRCFDIDFYAEWSAMSVWEHKEEYTIYESKTVYIDYYGKEHDSPGFDHFVNGSHIGTSTFGGSGKKPFKPMQKTVPVTKHKTVIDHMEQTYGDIEPEHSFEPIITWNDESEQGLCNWILSSAIGGSALPSHPGLMQGCEIKPLARSDDYALKVAMNNVEAITRSRCSAEVPGDRYENLSIYNFRESHTMEINLISLFHIEYEHEGKMYECWTSGSKSSTYFYNTMPEDENISTENKTMEEKVSEQRSKGCKSFSLVFLLMPLVIVFAFMLSIATGSIIPLVAAAVAEIILFRKYKEIKKELDERIARQENYLTDLREKKFAIATIMKNENLSDEDRRTAVNNILGK